MPRIRERTPGVWEITAATGRDPRTGCYGQVSKTVRGTRRAANQPAAELRTEVANGTASSPKGSVGHLIDAFLDYARARGLAPKTILGYDQLAEQAKAEFGAVDFRKLTAARLDSYYRGLIGRGLSPATVGNHHAFLRSALRQAVRWGWIVHSPADSRQSLSQSSRSPPTAWPRSASRAETSCPGSGSADQVGTLMAWTSPRDSAGQAAHVCESPRDESRTTDRCSELALERARIRHPAVPRSGPERERGW